MRVGPYRLCILCSSPPLAKGVTIITTASTPQRVRARRPVKLVMLEERGPTQVSDGVVVMGLTGDFLKDVLAVVKELSGCRRVKAVISDCSPYQAAVALIAATVTYERVAEVSVECSLTPHELCLVNAAIPHALGGREGRVTRLRLLAEVAGRCAPITELAKNLGLSPETTLRHAYALAAAGLVSVRALDGNPVVCGEVGPEIATMAHAITATRD